MQATRPISIDSPEVRRAGREVLSLALMDSRNHTLHLASQLEAALGADLSANGGVSQAPDTASPLWLLGHIGWFQEWWVLRNLQRQRGNNCDPTALRLASIDALADVWYNPALNGSSGSARPSRNSGREQVPVPDLQGIKRYLLETLEATLELLERSPEDDDALYFYRLALCHEDMQGEALIELAQALGVALKLPLPGGASAREPVQVPAVRWSLGSADSEGFAFDNERPAQIVQVPEFEIDAQPVTWAQFVEFVDDGGYDRPELWHADGWKWLAEKAEGEGRRGPRYVDQIGVASGAVMQTRFGKPMRMLGSQSATHVTWWEADAWARWAGRRLPAEVEWEVAAHTTLRQGFRWGDVWEWTGTTFRGYPAFAPGPWRDYSEPNFGTHKVLRGASFATRARMKNPKFRGFALPDRDEMFCGFRSCAL
jgi:gamma-glutamyl hercynylcysteine S-oxide synthase